MKIPLHLGILFLGLVLAGTSLAAEAQNSYLADGIALVRTGNYQSAEAPLRKAVELTPDDPQAAFYLGVALNRSIGGKEAESYLKQALRDLPEDPAVNMELGVHYYNKQIYAEAQDYFETTIALAPTSDYATKARKYLEKIATMGKEKPWQLTATAGFQYDSNVVLLAGNTPLPQGIAHKADYSGLFNVRALYTPVKQDRWDITLGANAFRSVHGSLHNYDITQGVAEIAGHYAWTPKLTTALSYNYEYVLLGDDAYDSAHNVTPSLTYRFEKAGTTTLEYCYRDVTYRNSNLIPTNTDRNGWNMAVTLTHIYPVSEKFSIWGAYTHDEEQTRQSFWDYSGNRAALGIRQKLLLEVAGDLSAKIHHREYGAGDGIVNPLTSRTENEYSGTVALSRPFGAMWSVSLDETYTRNRSNIDSFDYTRWVTTLMVNARF